MMQKIYNFIREKKEQGQSIIEYAILAAVIIAAVITFRSNAKIEENLSTIGVNMNTQLSKAVADSNAGNTGGGTP